MNGGADGLSQDFQGVSGRRGRIHFFLVFLCVVRLDGVIAAARFGGAPFLDARGLVLVVGLGSALTFDGFLDFPSACKLLGDAGLGILPEEANEVDS